MDRAWQEHLEALRRFNQWEAERLRMQPADYARALAWLSEAWELAARFGQARDPAGSREEHLQELIHLRRALERAQLSS